MIRLKIALTAVFLTVFSVGSYSQELSRQEFRNSEWKMKVKQWEQMQRLISRTSLDQSDYDVKYWELDINVTDISGQTISGKVTMTSESLIDGLSIAEYDLHHDMQVDSVMMSNQPVSYDHQGNVLTITLDESYNTGQLFTTVVYYHGHPAGGGFGSFSWDYHQGHPIISTLSEPEGAREWWPCKDQPHDKADSADVIITVPSDLVATSNGVLISDVDNGDGTRTFSWHISYPITTYLISLAITNYQSFTDWYVNVDGDSMPVTNYVYPEHYDNAVEDMSITPDVIGIYASLFGEYPFFNEKYGHSIFPWGGAMEHQCNTSYGAMLIRGDHAYDWILVHELSHQWFGDMITCDDWPDIWLNEGFASYCEALWTEQVQGFNAYLNYMRYFNGVSDPSGPIYDPSPLFDGNTVYNKGSWVLHMLRGVMGDQAFFDGMYAYANDPNYMYGTATTRQFQGVMEQFYGGDLSWFFDEWVWGMNRPHYTYSWMKEDIGNGQFEIFLHIDQTQGPPAPDVFIMPIKVYPRIGGVDTLVTVWNDSRQDDWRFVVDGDPSSLQVDKDHWILREVNNEPYGMNIVTTELPDGVLHHDYNAVVEARGGIPPYQFSVVDGQLPPGLSLDGSSGVISGQPSDIGDFSFTIRCTDSSNPGLTDDQSYLVTIWETTDVVYDPSPVPPDFLLLVNYPNPFNSSTVIRLQLVSSRRIRLEIFNLMGQKVATLMDAYLQAGIHDVRWNSGTVPSGVYFYKVSSGRQSSVKKMLLVK